ncbi:MAG: type II secretion system F family protein [Lachnospiraceae bacterium]
MKLQTHHKKAIMLLVVFLFIWILLLMKDSLLVKKQQQSVTRNEYGMGTRNQEVVLTDKNGEQSSITVSVSETQYDEKTKELKLKEAKQYVEECFLGENSSVDCVSESLCLPETIPDNAWTVSWRSDHYDYVDTNGNVFLGEITEDVLVTLTATFAYQEEQVQETYPVRITKRGLSEQDLKTLTIQQELQKKEEQNREEKIWNLPREMEGLRISLPETKRNTYQIIPFMGILAAIAMILEQKEKEKQKLKVRKAQLLAAYPAFVRELSLLMETGIPMKSCILRLAKRKHIPVLQEQLQMCVYQFQNGEAERKVYEEFATRIGLAQYRRLVTLMIQNLTKGSNQMRQMLQQEELQAIEQRIESAKQQGEVAGTKLLLPMLLLLLVVLMLVMAPALMSFQL